MYGRKNEGHTKSERHNRRCGDLFAPGSSKIQSETQIEILYELILNWALKFTNENAFILICLKKKISFKNE